MEGFRKVRTNDPQVIVTGRLKEGEKNDCITFSIPLGYFELVCIVSLPYAEAKEAPVYLKYKINNRFQPAVDGFMSMIKGIQAHRTTFTRRDDGEVELGEGEDQTSDQTSDTQP
jgi:hypothetical protein